MKNIIIFLVFVFMGIQVNAQEKVFKNFEVVQEGDFVFVLVPNFEEEFEVVKQEIVTHDNWDKDTLRLTDSINRWLGCGISLLEKKDPFDYGFGYDKLIPETLKQRLKGVELEDDDERYFTASVLVDNSGKILSLYFLIRRDRLSLFREEELQAICDGIMRSKIDAGRFKFSHVIHSEVEKMMDMILLTDDGEERKSIYFDTMEKKRILCKYGMIRCLDVCKIVLFQGENEVRRLLGLPPIEKQ